MKELLDDALTILKDPGSPRYKRMIYGAIVEDLFEWHKNISQIPTINFPAEWDIKIVPPYAGAIVRFIAFDQNGGEIRVYLDIYGMLGVYGPIKDVELLIGEPYWEAYPINGDTARFAMNDVKGLIKCMKDEFERRKQINV